MTGSIPDKTLTKSHTNTHMHACVTVCAIASRGRVPGHPGLNLPPTWGPPRTLGHPRVLGGSLGSLGSPPPPSPYPPAVWFLSISPDLQTSTSTAPTQAGTSHCWPGGPPVQGTRSVALPGGHSQGTAPNHSPNHSKGTTDPQENPEEPHLTPRKTPRNHWGPQPHFGNQPWTVMRWVVSQ